MREMTLQDIQAVSLDIMKHFHAFCVNHNIKYSLGYGTLIGAIRHKGFIPWDDDIDVVMMREDFDRFCAEYEDSDEYKLFAYSRENTYSVVARLCDMERTYVKTASPLFTEKTGLWIDIFPMDTVVEEKVDYEKEIAVIESIHYQIFQCRWQMRKFVLGDLCRIRTFMSWLKHVRRARKSIRGLVQKHNDLCVAHADSNSSAMSMLAFPTYKEAFPKRVFTNVKDTIFENEEFKIMEGYDEWLRIIYGEYMKLPPVEERKRSHSIHKYFWADRS